MSKKSLILIVLLNIMITFTVLIVWTTFINIPIERSTQDNVDNTSVTEGITYQSKSETASAEPSKGNSSFNTQGSKEDIPKSEVATEKPKSEPVTKDEPKEAHQQPEQESEEQVDGHTEQFTINNSDESEIVEDGQWGQVSTIIGNGVAGDGPYQTDHPRYPGIDSKGNIWFMDGPHNNSRLRMYNGEEVETIMELKYNKIVRKQGYFTPTGLAVINDVVYISSIWDVYKVYKDDGGEYRITQASPKIKQFMDARHGQNVNSYSYKYVYRMEAYDGDLYLMLATKRVGQYNFVKYDIENDTIEALMRRPKSYTGAQNFYVDKEGILIAAGGTIIAEDLYPRKTFLVVDTMQCCVFYDVFMDQEGYMYYSVREDKWKYRIVTHHRKDTSAVTTVAGGSGTNLVDGIMDEAQMDTAEGFIWDGSGYLFTDARNHAIRKLWIDVPPSSLE
jgi:hypothetical protein